MNTYILFIINWITMFGDTPNKIINIKSENRILNSNIVISRNENEKGDIEYKIEQYNLNE